MTCEDWLKEEKIDEHFFVIMCPFIFIFFYLEKHVLPNMKELVDFECVFLLLLHSRLKPYPHAFVSR